ncbi:MAG: O-antigen ligase family protein [Dehalococcoidia bacterium]|nr:O-antigen ligase family protein [Dehalococcoidia bacterium]
MTRKGRHRDVKARRATKPPASEYVTAGTIAFLLATLPWAASTSFADVFAAPKQFVLFLAAGVLLFAAAVSHVRLPASRAVALSIAGFAVWVAMASLLSEFPRESTLGWYGFRIGWTTWLAVAILLFATSSVSREPVLLAIVRAGAFGGLTILALVALGQQVGAADVLTDLRMATRNTGLAGTPNDLAACCILYLGFLWPVRERPRLTALAVAAATLAVFLSVSRAGVVLFVVTLAMAVVFGCVASGLRRGLRDAAWLGGAFVVGLLLALPTQTPAQLIGRFEHEIPQGTPAEDRLRAAGGPRFGFWQAGIDASADSPIFGQGADSLAFIYGQHRSESKTLDIYYDVAIASAHNSAIDIAIAGGIPALALLAIGIAFIVLPRLRALSGEPGTSFPLAAVAGFGALSLLNPLAIPQLAAFAVLLGVLTPSAPLSRPLPRLVSWAAAAAAGLLAVAGLTTAVVLFAAESRAASARDAAGVGDYERSVTLYRSAADVLPLERHYLAEAFVSSIDAASFGGTRELEAAIEAGYDLHECFAPLPGPVVALAGLIQISHPGDPRVESLLEEVARLEPASQRWAESIDRIRTLDSSTSTLAPP